MNTPRQPQAHNEPAKARVRHYLEQRLQQHCPPPSMSEIRRQLGWDLVPPAPLCGKT